jgi:dihydrofolate reductase
MGRKTFQSIGRPLPGRRNIVLTRDQHFSVTGIEVVHSIEEALRSCAGVDEVFIIGGAELFNTTLTAAQRIYLTHIDAHLPGDTFFPELESGAWHETSRRAHPRDERNAYDLSFRVLERIVR